jgi:hypothetical protein
MDSFITQLLAKIERAKCIIQDITEGYFGGEIEKKDVWQLYFGHKECSIKANIVYDYLCELEKEAEGADELLLLEFKETPNHNKVANESKKGKDNKESESIMNLLDKNEGQASCDDDFNVIKTAFRKQIEILEAENDSLVASKTNDNRIYITEKIRLNAMVIKGLLEQYKSSIFRMKEMV